MKRIQNIFFKHFCFKKYNLFKIFSTLVLIGICLLVAKEDFAYSQILVNYSSNAIGEFSAYGIPLNTNFIIGINQPQGIATDGTNIFVVKYGSGKIGKYTISGQIINAQLITNLNSPVGIAISGTNLFVGSFNSNMIGEYTTSGEIVNAKLISTPGGTAGLAISGTNLFVANVEGVIGEYTTSGSAINPHLISGIEGFYPAGLAISGANLFVLNTDSNVYEFTTSGSKIASPLITVKSPNGITISGALLYLMSFTGQVSVYTTSGVIITPLLFSAASEPGNFGIAVASISDSTNSPVLGAISSATNIVLSWPTNASACLVQRSPVLPATNWMIVTNTPILTNGTYVMNLPATNSAQFFRLQSIINFQ